MGRVIDARAIASHPVGRILIVWPSLFEGKTITHLVREISDICDAHPTLSGDAVEFLVADDSQGRDCALNELARDDARVRIFTPNSRLGHQRGLTAALRHLRGELGKYDAVVTMDADGEDRPRDVPSLIDPVLDGEADLVRAKRGRRDVGRSFSFGYLIYRTLFKALTGLRITSGNFAAASGAWWQQEISSGMWNLTFSGTLASINGRVLDILCHRDARREGASRMNFSSLIGYGLMFALPFSLRIAVRAAVLAVIASVLAAAMVVIVIILRFFTDTSTPGWTTIVAFGSAGVVLIAFVALTSALVLYASTSAARSDSGQLSAS